MEKYPQPEVQKKNPFELYALFAYSEWGNILANNSRWTTFKPDWVTNELWRGVLGDDVNNRTHLLATHAIADEFCSGAYVSKETRNVLLTTAITHDWGEALVGDIPATQKTRSDEKREYAAFSYIARDLLGEEEGKQLESVVLPVLSRQDAIYGEMFNVIEYIGYCRTGLRAGRVADLLAHGFFDFGGSNGQNESLLGGLLALHKAVEIRDYPILKEYAEDYPNVQEMLWNAP